MSNPELAEWDDGPTGSWLNLSEAFEADAGVFYQLCKYKAGWAGGPIGEFPDLPSAKRAAEVALRRELEAALARLGERGKETP